MVIFRCLIAFDVIQEGLFSCMGWWQDHFAKFKHYDRERGVYVWYISYTWHIPAQSLTVIHILLPVYLWYMSYTIQTSVNVPSTKIPHLELEWAVYGDVCQISIRNWQLHRNLWIFVPICMPNTCEVFGSRYSQVKLEGPFVYQAYTRV